MAIYYITFAIAIHCKWKNKLEQEDSEIEYPVPFHLEYELIPNELIYQAEVICWGPIAKVNTLDCEYVVKAVRHGELVWIAFSLTHLVKLDKKSITRTISNNIMIKLWSQKGRVKKGRIEDMNDVREDNETENVDKRWITWIKKAMLEETAPSIIKGENLSKEDTKLYKNKFHSSPHPQHWLKILQHIQDFGEKLQDDLLRVEKDEKDQKDMQQKKRDKDSKGRGIKQKEEDKKGKKNNRISTMTLNSSSLFAGKRFVENHIEIMEQNLLHATVILSGENLLTENDANELNPFIVKINKIKNIPFQVLKEANINKMYIKYEIFENSLESEYREINGPTILVDHAKIILTNSMDNVKLLQYLQTSRLFINVIGVQNESPEVKHVKENESKTQKTVQPLLINTNRSENSLKEKHIKIAVAFCHLSTLVYGQAFLEEDLPLYSENILFTRFSNRNDTEDYKAIEINNELLLNLSSIAVFVSFTVPLTMKSERLDPTGHICYNRLLIKINDNRMVKSILRIIVSINLKILSKMQKAGTVSSQGQNTNEMVSKMKENILTGFVIKTNNYTIFYIEGISNGRIAKVYYQVQKLRSCKILYNNSLVFSSRLYAQFIPMGGLYIVTLTNAMERHLRKSPTYMDRTMPKPCWKAIKLIDALLNCNKLQTASQYELFPSPIQLISLGLKFGVPHLGRKI